LKGEIVAFSLPEHPLDSFVKRIVAVEGDTLQIVDGVLKVNQHLAEYTPVVGGDLSHVNEKNEWGEYIISQGNNSVRDYGPIDIPKGHFFVLGDNRSDSLDSRTWGPIPYSCLNGRAEMVWLSVQSSTGIRTERIGRWVGR
jgi:signal peptidase I